MPTHFIVAGFVKVYKEAKKPAKNFTIGVLVKRYGWPLQANR